MLHGDHDPVALGEGVGQVLGLPEPDIHAQVGGVAVAPLLVLLDREQRGTWVYYSLRHDALGGLAATLDLQGGTR